MRTPTTVTPEQDEKADFSLVLGGPLYQLYQRTQLLRPPTELLHRRILAFALLTWIPLVPLTALERHFTGGVNVPFVTDLDALARLLISLTLLILAEPLVHRRVRIAVEEFLDRDLIAPEDLPKFQASMALAERLRNSVIAEVLLIVIALCGYWLWRTQATLHVDTWYAVTVEGTMQLTWAGYWYAFISLPITRFILFRWYYRLFIWYVFLWQVSRLRLRLNALHPDKAGGLEFLCETVFAFAPVLIAHTVLLAGLIANQIWHEGATLPAFKFEIAGLIVFLLLFVLLPLGFFMTQMAQAKRLGVREYGALGSRYVNEFRQKWIQREHTPGETPLGSSDIQSLADLGNSFNVANEMRVLPFNKDLLLHLAFLIALPLLPLILTMIPLDEILPRIIKVIL